MSGDDLDLALRLADLADAMALGLFRSPELVVEAKADGSVVTAADLAVEEAVRARLADERPGDAVLGEELGGPAAPGGRRWIVDPIDGTSAYADGRDLWGFLAGLEVDGEVVVGVVSAPALGVRYWAATGRGAWGGRIGAPPRRMTVSGTADLHGARVAFALPAALLAPRLGPGLIELSSRLRPLPGEPALAVTTAQVDVGFKSAGGPWDLAAFAAIVREAGGRLSDPGGGTALDRGAAIVTNGVLHDAVLDALAWSPGAGSDGV